MALLNTSMLDGLRGVVGQFFDQTANIYRYAATQDDTGGTSEGYPAEPTITGVPCMVRPAFRAIIGEGVTADQLQNLTLWQIRMPLEYNGAPVDVKPTDRIEVSSIRYEVKGVVGVGQSDAVNVVVTATKVAT